MILKHGINIFVTKKSFTEKIKELSDLQNPILFLKRKETLEEIFEVYTNNERLETLITKSQMISLQPV